MLVSTYIEIPIIELVLYVCRISSRYLRLLLRNHTSGQASLGFRNRTPEGSLVCGIGGTSGLCRQRASRRGRRAGRGAAHGFIEIAEYLEMDSVPRYSFPAHIIY